MMNFTRREALRRCGMGFGGLALHELLASSTSANDAAPPQSNVNPLLPKAPHFPAKAKRVIHIFANGGPSHVDTFDPKPALKRYAGQPMPGETPRTQADAFYFNAQGMKKEKKKP